MKANKDEVDEEGQAFLSDRRSSQDVPIVSSERKGLRWIALFNPRLFLELSMAAAILVLIVLWPSTKETANRKTPVPNCMH